MISYVFGLPGSGKTTFLAWCASRALRGKSLSIGLPFAGGCSLQTTHSRDYLNIYSNFPLLGAKPFDWEELGVFDYHDCLILVDEIMMLCDSRAWKTYPENIKYFMSHHRHYNIDFICCSQSYKDTDLRIRNLAQQFLLIENKGSYSRISPIHHYMDVTSRQIDDWYEKAAPLGCRFLRRKKLYSLFDSFSKKELKPLPDRSLWEVAENVPCGTIQENPSNVPCGTIILPNEPILPKNPMNFT